LAGPSSKGSDRPHSPLPCRLRQASLERLFVAAKIPTFAVVPHPQHACLADMRPVGGPAASTAGGQASFLWPSRRGGGGITAAAGGNWGLSDRPSQCRGMPNFDMHRWRASRLILLRQRRTFGPPLGAHSAHPATRPLAPNLVRLKSTADQGWHRGTVDLVVDRQSECARGVQERRR
jgi:hypothetical protein